MADGAGDDDKVVREAKALPLPERLAHSHWRVRADAYADVGTEASSAADTSSASLSEFGAPGALATPTRPRFDRACAACQALWPSRWWETTTPTRWTPAWMRSTPSCSKLTRSMRRGALNRLKNLRSRLRRSRTHAPPQLRGRTGKQPRVEGPYRAAQDGDARL